jgi:hypothetical protein
MTELEKYIQTYFGVSNDGPGKKISLYFLPAFNTSNKILIALY